MRRIGELLSGAAAILLVAGMGTIPVAQASTLEEALVEAYQTNPTLLADRARQRATDEGVALAASNWRPTVTATGTYADVEVRSDSGNPASGPFRIITSSANPFTGNITASQNLFRGFRSINEYRQANATVRAGRASLHTVEQTVLIDAIAAFLDVNRDEAVVGLRESNVTVLERQLDASQDRFNFGDSTRTDVAQAEARLSLAKSNLTVAETQLTASRAAFSRIVGTEPYGLEEPTSLPAVPASEDEALRQALAFHPTLRAAIETETASRRAVNVAVGAVLPSVRVDGSLSHSEDSAGIFGQGQVDSTSVTGVLTIPLYQSGAEYSAIRSARQTNSADRIRIAEAERFIRELIANAWEGLVSTQSVIVSSSEQVRANEIAFEGVVQEAQVGSRTTLDVLNAEQELLDSRVTLVRAQRDEQVAAYQLLAATGALTAEGLGLPVEHYDPTRHYRNVRWLPVGWGNGE